MLQGYHTYERKSSDKHLNIQFFNENYHNISQIIKIEVMTKDSTVGAMLQRVGLVFKLENFNL